MSNSVDQDETAHEPSRQDLCCLQKPIIIPVAVKELNRTNTSDIESSFLDLIYQYLTT